MSGLAMRRFLVSTRLEQCKYLNKRRVSSNQSIEDVRNNILYNPRYLEIPKVSVPEYIFNRIDPYWNYTAFECPITLRKFTFGDIRMGSRNLSKMLRTKLGLKKGDVALVYLQNCPEFSVALLGCMEAGVITSTANSLYSSEEVERQLKDCSAKIIITTHELYDNTVKAIEKLHIKLPIICVRTKPEQLLPQGAIDFLELINTKIDIPDLELPSVDDIAILPYSSGTTGLPKGVRLSHSNLISNITQIGDPELDIIRDANGTFQETLPAVLPMFHIYGIVAITLVSIGKGTKVITLPKFHPETFITTLKNYPVSLIYAAPPLILFLILHPEVKAEYFKTLRNILSSAAPLGALDEERFMQKAQKHVNILQGYGLTETSPAVTATSLSLKLQYGQPCSGSVGKVLIRTEVKLVKPGDDSGTLLGPYEKGEILVKGPQVMQGYHNNPEATKEAFLDGWLKTGDIAYYDENGLLFVTDRLKELIKVKGFQVAPAELEELLRSHPKVADAAVIGIPHEVSGEVPRAYVKLKEDANLDDISKFVSGKVARYKRLEGGIEVVTEIPKNPSGKIIRRQLKEKFLQEQQT